MAKENSLMGIGLFQSTILHLISLGKRETFGEIENNMKNGCIVEYICEKYKEYIVIPFNNSVYDNNTLNLFFQDNVGCIEGNETKKYGIMNENDGLLLIPALISDRIEREAVNWENETI